MEMWCFFVRILRLNQGYGYCRVLILLEVFTPGVYPVLRISGLELVKGESLPFLSF